MIRYIFYICIVLYVTYIGYFLSEKYRNKRDFYDYLEKFHNRFLSELNYKKSPLPDVIASFSATGEFRKLLDFYSKRHVVSPLKILTKEENAFLEEYFSYLGKSDYTGQKEYFSSVSDRIKAQSAVTANDAKKYTDLYVRLAFLIGLALTVCLM